MSGHQRLANLLQLADQGLAMRAALAEEVAELLTDWPADCPAEMRGPCEALLARAAREVDADIRARLRVRLYPDRALAARVLPRETQGCDLVEAARAGEPICPHIARALGLDEAQTAEILGDPTGRALAVACKGLGLSRAIFSTLAVLAATPGKAADCYVLLDIFDSLSATEAARLLRAWRAPLPHAAE